MAATPTVLCILDGWGCGTSEVGNAPKLAKTPCFDHIMESCPTAELITYGPDVGLPSGQMGNSEVGHMNIGAGRVVAMDLGQIDLAIENGSFGQNAALQAFIAQLQSSGGAAHVMALVSDGGVHGHIAHLLATLQVLSAAGVPSRIHAITDGRDVAPGSALGFIEQLSAALPAQAQIATVTGRYFAMDRDNRWERVQTAYDAMVAAQSNHTAATAAQAITAADLAGISDEFIPATVMTGYQGVSSGDGLFCLNFRADRAREILSALADPHFDHFQSHAQPAWAGALGMVDYSEAHTGYMQACFPKTPVVNTLGAWVARHGKRQFRVAETEKYPHVTFFLNGGTEQAEPLEERFMPHSPKVATYDLQPEMASEAVTDQLIGAINNAYDLIIVNYANPDMVGHTGDLNAAIKACEAVDRGLARVLNALEETNGQMILTADHGNCEMMVDPETGQPHTAHTLNPVPVALINGPDGSALRPGGRLADLAPTLLQLMGLDCPGEMTGRSLLLP